MCDFDILRSFDQGMVLHIQLIGGSSFSIFKRSNSGANRHIDDRKMDGCVEVEDVEDDTRSMYFFLSRYLLWFQLRETTNAIMWFLETLSSASAWLIQKGIRLPSNNHSSLATTLPLDNILIT